MKKVALLEALIKIRSGEWKNARNVNNATELKKGDCRDKLLYKRYGEEAWRGDVGFHLSLFKELREWERADLFDIEGYKISQFLKYNPMVIFENDGEGDDYSKLMFDGDCILRGFAPLFEFKPHEKTDLSVEDLKRNWRICGEDQALVLNKNVFEGA